MTELEQSLARILEAQPYRLLLAAPRKGGAGLRRAAVRPVGDGWQVERFTAQQAFHQNVADEALPAVLRQLLEEEFTQLHAFAREEEFSLRVTQKKRVLFSRRKAAQTAPEEKGKAHDRKKARLLPEGTVVPPLVDMGVLTAGGRVAAAMQDKYRQINRFVEMVEDVLRGYDKEQIRVVDFGCGKSYLTFILYYYLAEVKGLQVQMVGIDRKADVVARCQAAAEKYGYGGLHFVAGDIETWQNDAPADMVVTLHACDTATDHALAAAVRWGAGMILSVPCCQHELNGQIHSESLAVLMKYGIVKERTAALLTDAIRASLLEACGYKTQILEFVDFAHTPKNLLIRAVKAGVPREKRDKARAEAQRAMQEFGAEPALWRLLVEQGAL